MASTIVKRFTIVEAMIEKISAKSNRLFFLIFVFCEFTNFFEEISVNF